MQSRGSSAVSRFALVFDSPFLFFGVVVGYVLLFILLPANGFWINDNGLKFIQLQAFQINRFTEFFVPWPGGELDPAFLSAPIKAPFGKIMDGRLYVSYPPLFALISALPYRLLGMRGLYLIPLMAVLLLFLTVQKLGETLGKDPAHASKSGKVALLLTALASPVLFYSFTFWEHTLALAFCCLSLK